MKLGCNTLLMLIFLTSCGQEMAATIHLEDSTHIVNAPSGRDWTELDSKAIGFEVYPAESVLTIDDSEVTNQKYVGDWTISKKNITIATNSCNCSYSKTSGDHIVFKFTNAKQVSWIGNKKQNHGMVKVYLNDEFQAIIDTFSKQAKLGVELWSKAKLNPQKIYSLKLEIDANVNPKSLGGYIEHQYFKLE